MKKMRFVIIALAIYLIGLILGVIVVCAAPILHYMDFHFSLAQGLGKRYFSGEWNDADVSPNMLVAIYLEDGTCAAVSETAKDEMNIDIMPWVQKNLSRALSEKVFHVFVRQSITPSHRRTDIIMIIAVPMQELGGAVFLARRFVDLPSTISGFAVLYTIFFAATLLGFLFVKRKERELEQLRRDYITNINHELKSPISSIKALTETLYDGKAKDQQTQSRYYGIIISETNRLERAVKAMIELSKIQSSKTRVSKTRVSSHEIFEPVCNKFQALCGDMDIRFSAESSIINLQSLQTNAELVRQLLEILLDNAVKFVEEGGEIKISATLSNKHATICVSDNGIGITKDALPHIFERFYIGDRANNKSGTGLGLAIAMEIAMSLQEQLWVESKHGVGSAFYFTIHT